MNHIVSVSSGLSSAIAAERVLERAEKKKDVTLVFLDTLIEDEDNYRFLNECEARWVYFGAWPIVHLAEGRTPYQVAEDEGIIPNSLVAPCTRVLKIELFTSWMRAKFGDDPCTVHIGYDVTESHRNNATRNNYAKQGWAVDFPLQWQPYPNMLYTEIVREWGIEPPRMYGMGYTHANCGGVCVKQGHGDWIRTLIHFPERFAKAEAWENEQRQKPGRENRSISKDQSGGTNTPKTLKEIREDYEARFENQTTFLDELTYHAPCVHCGVGDLSI